MRFFCRFVFALFSIGAPKLLFVGRRPFVAAAEVAIEASSEIGFAHVFQRDAFLHFGKNRPVALAERVFQERHASFVEFVEAGDGRWKSGCFFRCSFGHDAGEVVFRAFLVRCDEGIAADEERGIEAVLTVAFGCHLPQDELFRFFYSLKHVGCAREPAVHFFRVRRHLISSLSKSSSRRGRSREGRRHRRRRVCRGIRYRAFLP